MREQKPFVNYYRKSRNRQQNSFRLQKQKAKQKAWQQNRQNPSVTLGEFYQFNLSSCIRQQNSLTAQFVS
ncbi:hypothetical protein AAH095_22265, partial [Phocaeicola vulgatus]